MSGVGDSDDDDDADDADDDGLAVEHAAIPFFLFFRAGGLERGVFVVVVVMVVSERNEKK
jgi:hypothetical protein